MLASVTLNDRLGAAIVLHETTKRALTSALGLVGVSGVRASVRSRPTAHGSIDETRWTDGATIALEGEIISQVGLVDAFAEFRETVRPMLETLDSGPALLKWTEGASGAGGNQLQKMVRLAGSIDPPIQEGAAILRWNAQFMAEDPRAYTQAETQSVGIALAAASGGMLMPFTFPFTFATSGGGTVSVTNAGNRPTPGKYRIYGSCVNPQIVLLGSGLRLAFTGTVAAGDYLEVDVSARTIRLNGSTNRQNLLDPAASTWFELAVGTNNLQLVASDFDGAARLEVFSRGAFA